MDITKENKLSKSSLPTPVEETPAEEPAGQLSSLFSKYSIEKYFWRSYNNKARLKYLCLIFLITILAVIISVLLCTVIFPA